jgi:hypothetical protein
MKKFITLLGVLLLTTSCLDLNGTLHVQESFNVKKKAGFLNLKTKLIELKPAAYKAELKVNSDKNYTLKLEGGDVGEIKIPIKADKDLNVPWDGKFAISHEQIDQPFDVVGVINTDVSYSEIRSTIENCSWTTTERRCEKICTPERKIENRVEPRKCDVVCNDIQITHNGRKEVDYHYRWTRRDIGLEFMRENSTALVATMQATDTQSDRIVDHESLCR